MMQNSNVHKWLTEKEDRRKILITLDQPLTAGQISKRVGIPLDSCSHILRKMKKRNLTSCMNPKSRNSRLYGLTRKGQVYRNQLNKKIGIPMKKYNSPDIDWQLYGWVCFDHRAAVIKALNEPMRASEIKKVLRLHKPNINISANNIRDIIRLFAAKNIVEPVKVKKMAYPRYQLTDIGIQLKKLLTNAQMKT